MWEVTDDGDRPNSRQYEERRIPWMIFTHFVSVFGWELLVVEPGRVVLQQGTHYREFRRLPDGSGKGK